MKWILYPLAALLTVNVMIGEKVFAWGPEGHMIVAQIAEDGLSTTAKQKVRELLEDQSLAQVANWADIIKGKPEWVHTKPWHFVDIPDGEDYTTIEHDHKGDVVTAITEQVDVLKDTDAGIEEKQEALKFIVHFVGDIHQPLHAGRPGDLGGNSIRIVFKGKKLNLHSLWDSGMISQQNMDYKEYARYLETMSFLTADYDIPEFPFSVVIREDMAVRKDIYNFNPLTENGPIVLPESYMHRNLNTLNQRLLLGGKRLAKLLNLVFK